MVEQRLVAAFIPYELDSANHIDLGQCFDLLSNLGGANSSKLIKSWLASWITSCRMHEETLFNCLLGCTDSPDSFSQFLQAPFFLASTKILKRDASNDPLACLSLVAPSAESPLCASCIFTGYHVVKTLVRWGNINLIINASSISYY